MKGQVLEQWTPKEKKNIILFINTTGDAKHSTKTSGALHSTSLEMS